MNARLVRGTWLLVALPLLLAAFSVARPQPLPPPTLPPTFEVAIAEQLARELAREYPDRSPGSPGGLGAAGWVADQFELYGFEPRVERFRAQIPGRGEVELQNLVTVVRGASQRAIVITAHRDNTGEGGGANHNASGTGALIELARAFASVGGATLVQAQPTHTLVFVSTDGGDFGALGAAHFAESSPYRENALAVISLDAIAGAGRPRLLIAGDTARSPSAALVRTAAVRVLEQTGTEPLRDSAVRQLLDLGFPFTLGEQGPFVARGIPAVTLTTLSDDIPRSLEQTTFDDTFSVQRLAELGRAAQNLIGSLDAGLELAQGTTSYIYFGTPHRPRVGNRARSADGPAAVPDRHHRPVRALPASPDRSGTGGAQSPRPALLLGLRGCTHLRSVAARRLPAGGSAAAAARTEPLQAVAGRPRNPRYPAARRLARLP